MSKLTVRQRKIVYGVLIVLLSIPIIVLGRPATNDSPGGQLAGMRSQYRLGEASLGEIDPSSATMNLVLLGLRGIATDVLWIQAIEQKETKNWGQLRTTVKSITLLQPHYVKVWDFQGWNLAYNVSAEWDAVTGRYYWVKEGAKFLKQGTALNRDIPEMPYWQARIIGQKIGVADEWRQYRRYFKSDPDPKFKGGPDLELNPNRRDNYLVARDLYLDANEKEAKPDVEQHIEARYLFRSKAAHSLIDNAMILQREGVFEESAQKGPWEQAYIAWTEEYGREAFATRHGSLRMDPTEEELVALAKEQNVSLEELRRDLTSMQNIVNYRYWKRRADAERRGETEEAHRSFYLAERAFFRENNFEKAQQLVENGLEKYSYAFNNYLQDIKDDRFAIEEGLRGVLLLRYIHEFRGTPMPDLEQRFGPAISALWLTNQSLVPEIERDLQRLQQREE